MSFIYIMYNDDWFVNDKKYKFGYTDRLVDRLHDSKEQFSERKIYIYIVELKRVGYPENTDIDKIFTNCKKDFKPLNEVKKYLVNGNCGKEFIYHDGLELFKNFIKNEIHHFKVEFIREYTQDEIDEINQSKIESNIDDVYNSELQEFFDGLDFEIKVLKFNPFEYQKLAIEKSLKYYETNNFGNILWSCGLGKTYLSLFIGYELKADSILICVPSTNILNQFKNSVIDLLGDLYQIKSIHSQGDQIELQDFNNKIIIISTYHSCNKVLKFTKLNNIIFDFKIGDEAHHLVCLEKNPDKNTFDKFHFIQSKKTLFMTATKKEIEEVESHIDYFTMSNKDIFGLTIDELSIKWAIDNKKITDYEIIIIKNSIPDLCKIIEQNDLFVNIKNKEQLFISAYMALKSLNDGYCTHILIYANKCESTLVIKYMIRILLEKNIFSNLIDVYNQALFSNNNIYHNSKEEIQFCEFCKDPEMICSEINKHNCSQEICKYKCKRDLNIFQDEDDSKECELNKFKSSKFGIISCVYIFGEGFDLPKLNGVVVAENMTSDIRIVQSCLRANRLEASNPDKKAAIILPYNPDSKDDRDKIITVIDKMGNFDETIEQKIKVLDLETSSSKSDLLDKEVKLKENKTELEKIKVERIERINGQISTKSVIKILVENEIKNENEYKLYLEKNQSIKIRFKENIYNYPNFNWKNIVDPDNKIYYLDLVTCQTNVKKIKLSLKDTLSKPEFKRLLTRIRLDNGKELHKYDSKIPPYFDFEKFYPK